MIASCGERSAGLPRRCNEAAENKCAQGDDSTADTTAAEVKRNSSWELRLAAAQAVTRCANTEEDRPWKEELVSAAVMMPAAQGRHCCRRWSLEGVNDSGSAWSM
jgi:hypothetical protein